jgi:phosphatidylserine/phosphatidylglycerophosphate/cardiolipin synthase-like enzyme
MASELRYEINHLIQIGVLEITQHGFSDDKIYLKQLKTADRRLPDTTAVMVISRPRMRELGFLAVEQRNLFLETSECFSSIIKSAQRVLRICSPFLQKDVLTRDSLPHLKELLLKAITRGVEIKILSRELNSRSDDVSWVLDIGSDIKSRKLTIVDYHLTEKNAIYSSTHAKIICADYDLAYVGSAELRRNSIVANFEIGCYLRGPQVYGICEAFDLMFRKGQEWKL